MLRKSYTSEKNTPTKTTKPRIYDPSNTYADNQIVFHRCELCGEYIAKTNTVTFIWLITPLHTMKHYLAIKHIQRAKLEINLGMKSPFYTKIRTFSPATKSDLPFPTKCRINVKQRKSKLFEIEMSSKGSDDQTQQRKVTYVESAHSFIDSHIQLVRVSL